MILYQSLFKSGFIFRFYIPTPEIGWVNSYSQLKVTQGFLFWNNSIGLISFASWVINSTDVVAVNWIFRLCCETEPETEETQALCFFKLSLSHSPGCYIAMALDAIPILHIFIHITEVQKSRSLFQMSRIPEAKVPFILCKDSVRALTVGSLQDLDGEETLLGKPSVPAALGNIWFFW